MYPVSEAFLQAVQENTRKYCWTGKITTKAGTVYPFGYEDIMKGRGYIALSRFYYKVYGGQLHQSPHGDGRVLCFGNG